MRRALAEGARVLVGGRFQVNVLKLCDEVDFVANECRMGLEYDPDATRMPRAARAETFTSPEISSILLDS